MSLFGYSMDSMMSSSLVTLALGFGLLVLIALLVTAPGATSLNGRRAEAAVKNTKKVEKPVVMNPLAKRAAPEIVKHVPAPRMEPKSLPIVSVAEPVAEPVAPKSTLDATFDAYRSAMKASSLEARGMSIAQKMSSVPRSNLRVQGKAADFLESMNQSIDERLVAQFDSAAL